VTERRFPPPWTVEERPACFVVRERTAYAAPELDRWTYLGSQKVDFQPSLGYQIFTQIAQAVFALGI
jgi:hypothetical protein